MMKKRVLLLLTVLMACLSINAEQTALLYGNSPKQLFTGYRAFVDAYNAAVAGDTITLSEGYFLPPDEIRKSLYICGNGAFWDAAYCTVIESSLMIYAENTTIEGIVFAARTAGIRVNTNNVTLKRCLIEILSFHSLTAMYARYGNTLIDQCSIGEIQALSYVSNILIYNSTIGRFEYDSVYGVNNNAKDSRVVNCVIYSCLELPIAVYENNIIEASRSYSFYAKSVFRNNLFYDDTVPKVSFPSGCEHSGDMYSTWGDIFNNSQYLYFPAVIYNVPNGNDGTPVGIYGGRGYRSEPDIPSIFTFPEVPIIANNFIFGQLDQVVKMNATTTGNRIRYWWNDNFETETDFNYQGEIGKLNRYAETIEVPRNIHGKGYKRGVATLHISAVTPSGAMSAPIDTDITYAIGPTLNASSYYLNAGNVVTLKWKGQSSDYDYTVYYSLEEDPWILCNTDVTYDSETNIYSTKFKGKKGIYRFVVTYRTYVTGIGYVRTPIEDEWSVRVCFN